MSYPVPKIRISDPFIAAVLLCYLLENLGKLTDEQLTELVTLDEMVGYFELAEAFGYLEDKGLAEFSVEGLRKIYKLNETGRMIVGEFQQSVPLTIREKTLAEGRSMTAMIELKRSVDWRIDKAEKGYIFTARFLNEFGGPDIMDVRIYAPTIENAEDIQRRFLETPVDIIRRTMDLYTKDSYL